MTDESLTAEERETTIQMDDVSDVAYIWTAQRRVITLLRKQPDAKITGQGYYGTTEWVHAEIPLSRWNPVTGFKARRKPLTDEQKAAAAARLTRARASSGEPDTGAKSGEPIIVEPYFGEG